MHNVMYMDNEAFLRKTLRLLTLFLIYIALVPLL